MPTNLLKKKTNNNNNKNKTNKQTKKTTNTIQPGAFLGRAQKPISAETLTPRAQFLLNQNWRQFSGELWQFDSRTNFEML